MSAPKPARKLSDPQLRALQAVGAGDAYRGCNFQGAYGGRLTSLCSLVARKLVTTDSRANWQLTDAGRALLETPPGP